MHHHEVALGDIIGEGHIARQPVNRVSGRAKADAAMHGAAAAVALRVQHFDPVDDADLTRLEQAAIDAVVQEHMQIVAHRLDPGGQREGCLLYTSRCV